MFYPAYVIRTKEKLIINSLHQIISVNCVLVPFGSQLAGSHSPVIWQIIDETDGWYPASHVTFAEEPVKLLVVIIFPLSIPGTIPQPVRIHRTNNHVNILTMLLTSDTIVFLVIILMKLMTIL